MVRIALHGDTVELSLARGEPLVLAAVIADVRELIAAESTVADGVDSDDPLAELVGPVAGPAPIPDDPALARLFPDAYGDDLAASAEFRGLTAASLRDGKLAALDAVLGDLRGMGPKGRLRLAGERAETWIAALTDVRLVIGTRLGVTDDVWEQVDRMGPDDPRRAAFEMYDLLTHLQERLVHAVAGW